MISYSQSFQNNGAEKAGPEDDMTSCTICFEEYSSEKHIPRILPCFHSLCEPCIENIFRTCTGKKQLQCPECRVTHKADRQGAKTFPQNRYIISHLPMKKKLETLEAERNLQSEIENKYMRCPDHKLEMTLICTEEHCNEKICSRCYLDEHKLHDIMDIDKEKSEYQKLEANINTIIESTSEELDGGKRHVEEHYAKELQKLHKFQSDTIAVINSFANRKRQEIVEDKEKNLREISDVKSNLVKAKADLGLTLPGYGKFDVKLKRINARQAERLHESILQKINPIKKKGIQTRSNHYENAQIKSELSLAKMHSDPSPAPVTLKKSPVLYEGKIIIIYISLVPFIALSNLEWSTLLYLCSP